MNIINKIRKLNKTNVHNFQNSLFHVNWTSIHNSPYLNNILNNVLNTFKYHLDTTIPGEKPF